MALLNEDSRSRRSPAQRLQRSYERVCTQLEVILRYSGLYGALPVLSFVSPGDVVISVVISVKMAALWLNARLVCGVDLETCVHVCVKAPS